jgi:hypothetical protein
MLLAGARLRQFGAQLQNLRAQRVEGAGKMFRHGTEGNERLLKFTASVFDQLEFCGCHAGGESNFRALAAFTLIINRLRRTAVPGG